MNDHDRFDEDLAAYALGALPPDDAAELERHLEGCEVCRQQLRWLSASRGGGRWARSRCGPPPGWRR
jgi:anti-sigma factor RsiW